MQGKPSLAKPVTRRRCNSLDGKRWIQNSISVWSDLRKTPEELRLKHPAMFPAALAARLIESFLPAGRHVVLDPFAGTGSTLVAAVRAGKQAIGLELSPTFVAIAKKRVSDRSLFDTVDDGAAPVPNLHQASATDLSQHVAADSVDLCVTSPPYWNILNQRRTADSKAVRHYGNLHSDLGTIADYGEFLSALTRIFADVLKVLKAGAHCCVVVMDLRKKNRFYPFHSDLAGRLQEIGFLFDDLIIWNRQAEYNNLRPLGFPSVFRMNKVHEFILLMQKPASTSG
ncbi:MAG: DNA methyltransferase [Deltaproteobacteria bacterium]